MQRRERPDCCSVRQGAACHSRPPCASPLMPLFFRGVALAVAPAPRGCGMSPSASGMRSRRTHTLEESSINIVDVSGMPACELTSRNNHEGFLIFASIALAFMASRRLDNAIVAWTDLQQLTTYAWLASWMWIPAVAAWALAWNRWCPRPSRSIDLLGWCWR